MKRLRGIKFLIPNLTDTFISKILEGICVEQYIWKISEDEVYLEGESLFLSEKLNGQDFRKAINHPRYYVVFANLQAYPVSSDFCELNTYEDYLKSTCEIVVLITDCIFVDIYCKQQADIEIIKTNAVNNYFCDIEYVTDENDIRTDFCAI